MQDDNELSMEIGALKLEIETCKSSMTDLLNRLSDLDPIIERILASKDKNLSLCDLDNVEELLLQYKREQRDQLVLERVCTLCCNSFDIRGLLNIGTIVPYNGQKYHSFCINYWINKVKTNRQVGQTG